MKKLLFLLIFCAPSIALAQELNDSAKLLKKQKSQTYNAIKDFAVSEWNEDHSMIVYEINKQSESFFKVFRMIEGNEEIFSRAIAEWGEDVTQENLLKNPKINWSMVSYEMEKQIKAKKAY